LKDTPVKSDAQLKQEVQAELAWDPSVDARHVAVTVAKGVVTLRGQLDSFAEKHAIERAVQRVRGVHAIAVELDVTLAPAHQRSDSEIALAIETVLTWQARVPADRIQVQVEQGWVTLRGEVDWDYERQQAERVVRPLTGVSGLTNAITLKPCALPSGLAVDVQQALARLCHPDAEAIEASVDGATVLLSGKVSTWAERQAAERAAWSAPGVCHVVNDIVVRL
jgi:osmotically-inducible protein OsmY